MPSSATAPTGRSRADTTRVLIADDHPLVLQALRRALRPSRLLDVVGEAHDGAEALAKAERIQPDLILTDVRMPGPDGFGILERCRELGLETRVVFLSAFAEGPLIYDAIAAGAAGYISKRTPPDGLRQAVEAVARGETVIPDDVQSAVAGEIRTRAADRYPTLSPRELEILELVAAGQTSATIAEALYLSEPTIKAHLRTAYGKLGVSDRASAVAEAMRRRLID